MEEWALVHWPDGTEEVLRVFERTRRDQYPFTFAEAHEKVANIWAGRWVLEREERCDGLTEGGRRYHLEVWVGTADG
jgi:hypothetical protein